MNLFELFIKVGVDDQASGKLGELSKKLGNGLKTAAKIGMAAVGAAAAGITALTTAAVNNYAEYEQLVGGVETLFKNSSATVLKYAKGAYASAGLSANQYMATVTGFAAALLQSLGGDTEAAAKRADMAITDMADNANKMGTSLEALQNAYAGFSKGNFMMLDNLKLGYGGTRAEMERLLRDAEKLPAAMGRKFDISNYADIVEAIHLIQEEMGIAGATALEAGTTIEGSVNSMKAAWRNLVAGLADSNADIGELVNNLVTSIVGDGTEKNLGVLGNIMPAIKTALNGASKLVSELLPVIVAEIPAIISENLPVLASAAVSVIQSLVDGISRNSDLLVGAVFDAFESIIGNLPALIESLSVLIPNLVSSILEQLPDAIQTLVTALTDGGVIENLTEAAVGIVQAIADNLPMIIQSLVDAIPRITESVNSAILNNFPALLQAIIQIVLTIVRNLPTIIQMLVSQIGPIVSTIVQVIVENLPQFIAGIVQIVVEIVKALPSILASVAESIWQIFGGIGRGLVNAWPKFKEGLANIWSKLTSWFGGLWEKTKNIGKNIIDGIKQGISNAWNNLVSWFKGLFGDLIGIAKRILGIKSPAVCSVTKLASRWLPGLGLGWEDGFGKVKSDIEDSLDFDDASVGINASIRKVGAGAAGGAFGGTSIGNITINIDGAKYSDEQSLAEAIALKFRK